MTAKQILQLQQQDIIKTTQGNVFTNCLLNQQKSDYSSTQHNSSHGNNWKHTNSNIMYSGLGLEVLDHQM